MRTPMTGAWEGAGVLGGAPSAGFASLGSLRAHLSVSQVGLSEDQVVTSIPSIDGPSGGLTAMGGPNSGIYKSAGPGVRFDQFDDAYDATSKADYNFLHQGDCTIGLAIDFGADVSGFQCLFYSGLDAPGGLLTYIRNGALNVILSNDTSRIASGASSVVLSADTRHVIVQQITSDAVSWWVDGVHAGSVAVTGVRGSLDSEFLFRFGRFGNSWALGAIAGDAAFYDAIVDHVALTTLLGG